MTGEVVYLLDKRGPLPDGAGEAAMKRRLKMAKASGSRVMTTSMTLIEAFDPTRYLPAWHRALSLIRVEPVTEEIAKEATGLLKETGLHGHKYATDAALAAVALRQPGPVTVFTSDEDDMRKLCADRVVVVEALSRARPVPHRTSLPSVCRPPPHASPRAPARPTWCGFATPARGRPRVQRVGGNPEIRVGRDKYDVPILRSPERRAPLRTRRRPTP